MHPLLFLLLLSETSLSWINKCQGFKKLGASRDTGMKS